MGFVKEFKEFAMRGNVIDLAVGVIIGGAFGKITNSLVNDIIMPPVGKLLGNTNFSNLFLALTTEKSFSSLDEAKKAGVATINYGVFMNTVLDFLIMALVIFVMVKQINRLKPAPAPAPAAPATKECPHCCEQVPVKATRCRHCTSTL